jgi:hypothetical protein
MKNYVTYPPQGLLPLPGGSPIITRDCDVWDEILSAALIVNPAFNIYRIFDTVSTLLYLASMSPSGVTVADSVGCAWLCVSFTVSCFMLPS